SNTHFTPTSCERHLLQEDLMTLRSDRHLATLCSSTALLLRGRLVDKAPGARLLIKARALHSDAHRRSRIYGRNPIPHSNPLTVTCSAGSIYAGGDSNRRFAFGRSAANYWIAGLLTPVLIGDVLVHANE